MKTVICTCGNHLEREAWPSTLGYRPQNSLGTKRLLRPCLRDEQFSVLRGYDSMHTGLVLEKKLSYLKDTQRSNCEFASLSIINK